MERESANERTRRSSEGLVVSTAICDQDMVCLRGSGAPVDRRNKWKIIVNTKSVLDSLVLRHSEGTIIRLILK